jgi:exo-beta-1,3-glucanase (GH17 family)
MNPTDTFIRAAVPPGHARRVVACAVPAPGNLQQDNELMNMRQPSAALSWAGRFVLAAAYLGLAACGQSQNWSSSPTSITIGGTVSGLSGTLSLADNVADPLTITSNGPFTFALQLASGASYNVAITAQPTGQTCTLTNASGTSTSNVTNIGVTCASTPSIGGTLSGLTSGSVVLQNNGGNNLTVTNNGSFTFSEDVASGGAYAVTVLTQPANGETCVVANGSGTATADVTSVTVTCTPFTLRALPTIYSTGQAVAYSPYRAGGPNAGEVPSNADIIQDLQLLQAAGYNLIRLFGADAVDTNILALASTNTPTLKFQVGIYLEGAPITCVDTVNDTEIATGIMMANTYPNVVTVSVGNETSFAGNLPISCLVSYVQRVRAAVTQPVTADDDYTFYDGSDAGADYAPDTVLQNIDFVSFHTYPFSDTGSWDWQQTGVAAGSARAAAMMAAALAQAQHTYALVAGYSYKNSSGQTTTIGASLPITIGETGWKATPTNPGAAIEQVTNPAIANPVNAKWYYDLLRGWTGTGAPLNIFYFEAFDEPWKGTDDGWGLWNVARDPLYALCGLPSEAACTPAPNTYSGAGYYH